MAYLSLQIATDCIAFAFEDGAHSINTELRQTLNLQVVMIQWSQAWFVSEVG
jgi:hypothetical protein